MEQLERFAINLTLARQAKGISQEELGFRSSLHRTEISLLERAERQPRLDSLLKLVAALDVTVGDLCAGMEWLTEERHFKVDPPPKPR